MWVRGILVLDVECEFCVPKCQNHVMLTLGKLSFHSLGCYMQYTIEEVPVD